MESDLVAISEILISLINTFLQFYVLMSNFKKYFQHAQDMGEEAPV